MFPNSWWRFLNTILPRPRGGARRKGRRQTSRRPYCPLRVERLEDRITPSTFYVDNSNYGTPGPGNGMFTPNGGDQTAVTGLTLGVNLFTTISDAVTAASPGDTIDVADGTYNELVQITKDGLILQGNNYLTGAQTRSTANESILSNGTGDFQIEANNVTIAGFTIAGVNVDPSTDASALGAGIWTNPGFSGTNGGYQIINNIIQDNISGIFLNNDGTNSVTVQDNLIQNNNQPGSGSGNGIDSELGLQNTAIDSNTFTNNPNAAVFITGSSGGQSGITISANTMTGNGGGVDLFNTTSSSITQNTITASTGSQIYLGGGVSGLQITQNFLDNGDAEGILVQDLYSVGASSSVTVNDNHIQGNATAGLEVDSGAYTGTLDATYNWWGSATGPTTANNPGGTGDTILDPDGVVNFSPYLTDGTDAQPATPGFQPAANPTIGIAVVGTGNPNDTLAVTATGTDSGSYSLNGGTPVPFSNVTRFTFTDTGSNNTFTIINPSGGLFAPTDGIFDDGGGSGSLQIQGGTEDTATYTFNADTASGHNGTITLVNGATTAQYTYSGLSPISNSGTAADIIFKLPTGDGDNQAILEDNGDPTDNMSQIASGNGTFETAQFTNPTSSLTVNTGDDGETVTFAQMDPAYNPTNGTTINGGTGADTLNVDFSSTVNVIPTGGITFAGGSDNGDAITFVAGYTATNVTDNYTDANSGSISVDGSVVTYSGLSQTLGISDPLAAATRTFNFSSTVSNNITLGDDAIPNNGISEISSTASNPTTDFANPTTSVTVDLGNAGDTITAGPLDATSPPPTINVNGGTGSDTFDVTPSTGSTFNVEGNLPDPPTTPGDTLNVTIPAGSDPLLTSTATPTGYTGNYAFGSSGYQPLNFTRIETLTPSGVTLTITKDDGVTSAVPGTTVTYTIVAQNTGSLGVSGVSITDMFSTAEFTSVTYTSSATGGATGNTISGTGDINDTAVMPAGSSITYSATATINPSALGTLSNTATITPPTGTGSPSSSTDSDSLTPQADLSVTQTGPATVTAGMDVTYTLTLTNSGPSDAENVVLTDAVPAGATFVSEMQTGGPGFTLSNPPLDGTGTITGTISNLASGASATFTVVVHSNATAANGSTITNTVSVSSSATDNNSGNNTATTTTTVSHTLPPPCLSVAFGPYGEDLATASPGGVFAHFDQYGTQTMFGSVQAMSIAFDPFGNGVADVVYQNGDLVQFDIAGTHVLMGGVQTVSMAFGPMGEVLDVVFQNGNLTQYDALGAHPVMGGVQTVSVAFGPMGEVLDVVLQNGVLMQFDPTGVNTLVGDVQSVSLALNSSGIEVIDVVFQNGVLAQFDAAGYHPLLSGVQTASVGFLDPATEILNVIFQDGSLFQYDPLGAYSLGNLS